MWYPLQGGDSLGLRYPSWWNVAAPTPESGMPRNRPFANSGWGPKPWNLVVEFSDWRSTWAWRVAMWPKGSAARNFWWCHWSCALSKHDFSWMFQTLLSWPLSQMRAARVATETKCHTFRKEVAIAFPSTWQKLGISENAENAQRETCGTPTK